MNRIAGSVGIVVGKVITVMSSCMCHALYVIEDEEVTRVGTS